MFGYIRNHAMLYNWAIWHRLFILQHTLLLNFHNNNLHIQHFCLLLLFINTAPKPFSGMASKVSIVWSDAVVKIPTMR